MDGYSSWDAFKVGLVVDASRVDIEVEPGLRGGRTVDGRVAGRG